MCATRAADESGGARKALVTDLENRLTLPVVRALGAAGIEVLGMAHARFPLGGFSKYCTRVYRCADPGKDEGRFLDDLERVCARVLPSVLLPVGTESQRACLYRPSAWQPYTRSLLPSLRTLEVLSDKWRTLELARSLGIAIPESHCPANAEELEQVAAHWRGPFVVKPRDSSGSYGVVYGSDPGRLVEAYESVARCYSRPIIQERIPAHGAGVGVSVLMGGDREVVAVFGHRRLREYPVSGGPSTLRESIMDESLSAASTKLLSSVGMSGVAMVEFKWHPAKERYVLLEVNPRFWGSLQLAVHAGVNFPLLYFRLAMQERVQPVLDYPVGVRCRWLWPGDLLHFLSNPDRFRMDPSFFRFRDENMGYDVMSWSDPLPMAGMFIAGIGKLFRRGDSRRVEKNG